MPDEPTTPAPLMAPRLRRMCGGGLWGRLASRRWDNRGRRPPGESLRKASTVRRVPGAVIFDGPGVAIAWREDWR